MKTGFQSSIKKSAETRHPFYEIWSQFWGPFLSKKSVVCRSKTSLICGPLKIVILTPSGTQKAPNLRSLFDANLMDFEDDWDEQCTEINVLFAQYFLCYFSSSALVLLVSMDDGKHIYEAELQLSTRFPFLCQDRFIFLVKWRSENEIENKY